MQAALSAVTAAVVGVIVNFSVWFAFHTIFGALRQYRLGPIHAEVPVASSLDPGALLICLMALVAMLRFRLGTGWTLLGAAACGVAWTLARVAG